MTSEAGSHPRSRDALRGVHFPGCVAEALLHVQDPIWLDDSPLVALPEVQRRSASDGRLFAGGIALRALLIETIESVAQRLPNEHKPAILRETLEGVLRGESISAIARRQGRSREHFSRTYWKLATRLVADALRRR